MIDFEIPKKYGLRQTIADTLGIGGIFRALRTIPVMLDFCRDHGRGLPRARWLLNYTNPMAMLTGAILRGTGRARVGLCHSVQGCARWLCWHARAAAKTNLQWKIAGINHQAWLLEITRDGEDLYPEIKRRAQLPEYCAQGHACASRSCAASATTSPSRASTTPSTARGSSRRARRS